MLHTFKIWQCFSECINENKTKAHGPPWAPMGHHEGSWALPNRKAHGPPWGPMGFAMGPKFRARKGPCHPSLLGPQSPWAPMGAHGPHKSQGPWAPMGAHGFSDGPKFLGPQVRLHASPHETSVGPRSGLSKKCSSSLRDHWIFIKMMSECS